MIWNKTISKGLEGIEAMLVVFFKEIGIVLFRSKKNFMTNGS